jgi:hypothetical protein
MSALNNQTNRNTSRFFFATAEAAGDQTLGLQFGSSGGTPNLSTTAVTISGTGGNGVIINQGPSFQATEYIFAEEGMGVYGSTYFTPSTLATTITGINFSSDRTPASGIACIESYGGNGTYKGFEFLGRGVNSELISTPLENYFSGLGSPGALAILDISGQFVAPAVTTLNVTTTNVNSYEYPQAVKVYPQFASTVVTTLASATPTVVFTLPDPDLTQNALYQSRVMANLTIGNPGSNECYLELGLRLGGTSGETINQPPIFVPLNGTAGFALATSINVISRCGSNSQDVDIIAYQQNSNGGNLDITINTASPNPGIPPHLFKQIT